MNSTERYDVLELIGNFEIIHYRGRVFLVDEHADPIRIPSVQPIAIGIDATSGWDAVERKLTNGIA